MNGSSAISPVSGGGGSGGFFSVRDTPLEAAVPDPGPLLPL